MAYAGAASAAILGYCDAPAPPGAARQDKLLRFAAVIKDELERSGERIALVSRSGLDLSRFGLRYSHAGLSLLASENTAWSVRQLYYACDEGRPRIFDQGIAGFVQGTSDPAIGYISIVFMPGAASSRLERAALDDRRALALLGTTYSANAYAYAARHQNCNQWVIELMASAWGELPIGDAFMRSHAQHWLREQNYTPSVIAVGSRFLAWLGAFIPWVHNDDHPREDLEQAVYRVSMPASIEAFVRANVAGAQRVELCHTDRHIVIRRGWSAIEDGCRAGEGDTVIALETAEP